MKLANYRHPIPIDSLMRLMLSMQDSNLNNALMRQPLVDFTRLSILFAKNHLNSLFLSSILDYNLMAPSFAVG